MFADTILGTKTIIQSVYGDDMDSWISYPNTAQVLAFFLGEDRFTLRVTGPRGWWAAHAQLNV
jgi:hypothetical protein